MKAKDMRRLGIPHGECTGEASEAVASAREAGVDDRDIRTELKAVVADPSSYTESDRWAALARALLEVASKQAGFVPRETPAPYRVWGEGHEETALEQMERAVSLPISVMGALMADAHLGYGLPIGGVLATDGAVIPYAVGMDIACRMRMSVLDMPVGALENETDKLKDAVERETRFGVGSKFTKRRQHPVMDEDWSVSPVTERCKDRAWAQLGTSGSGNHFAEYGVLTVESDTLGIEPGTYLAFLSHSGSRGTGAEIAKRYSSLAKDLHRELPRELETLAWLDLDTDLGREYWAAMELMGKYAAANHELIHRSVTRALGVDVLLDIENHHNYAWKETHRCPDGREREVIVHRKGATPAGEGVIGIIPGSMATPCYVARGKGSRESLDSAAHGAGRKMSRKRAKKLFTWKDARAFLADRGVTLISAGLDEVPMAYKDIDEVMAAQADLVEPVARFDPKLVKMAPGSERR